MKNTPLWILVSGICVIVIIIIGSIPETQSTLAYYLNLTSSSPKIVSGSKNGVEQAKVNRVVDGDTIVLEDGRTIRYLNMDTPETKKPNTPVMCYGKEASDENHNWIENKEILLVKDKEDQDRYGRYLRFVFLIGKDTTNIKESINYKLVEDGFARSYIVKPNNTYEKVFADAEKQAKKQNLRVWQCPKPFEE